MNLNIKGLPHGAATLVPTANSVLAFSAEGLPYCVPLADVGNVSPAGPEGEGAPVGVVIPTFIRQLYHDTTADTYYRSTGLTSADWVAIGGGGSGTDIVFLAESFSLVISSDDTITSLSFPNLTEVVDIELRISCSQLTSISAPLLSSAVGGINLGSCPLLTAVEFPSLATAAYIGIGDCASLVSLSFPALITATAFFNCEGSALLANVSVPLWLPTNGEELDFIGCALSQASVDHILSRCVASAGFVSGTVDLSGGTNSPPSSVAEGSDYAVLIARGVTVTVNS